MISSKILCRVSPASSKVVSLLWLTILDCVGSLQQPGSHSPRLRCSQLAELQVFVAGDATVTSVEYGMYVFALINLKNLGVLSRHHAAHIV